MSRSRPARASARRRWSGRSSASPRATRSAPRDRTASGSRARTRTDAVRSARRDDFVTSNHIGGVTVPIHAAPSFGRTIVRHERGDHLRCSPSCGARTGRRTSVVATGRGAVVRRRRPAPRRDRTHAKPLLVVPAAPAVVTSATIEALRRVFGCRLYPERLDSVCHHPDDMDVRWASSPAGRVHPRIRGMMSVGDRRTVLTCTSGQQTTGDTSWNHAHPARKRPWS